MDLLQVGRNAVAFIFSVLLGYILASFLPEGGWFTFAYMLITTHLFFGWLVISKEHETGSAMPTGPAILIHLAFLALIVCLGFGRNYIPLFKWIRYAVPASAYFEVRWLLRIRAREKEVQVSAEKNARVAAAVAAAVNVDDYQEWLSYLAKPDRPPRRPGMTVEEEYKEWLLARAKGRLPVHSKR